MVDDEGTPDQPDPTLFLEPETAETPARRPEEIAPDPAPKERKPLNPAYAILAGAVLTATSGITATFLTIRSSERLTRERDRTDLARQERDVLQKELEKVKSDLASQSARIVEFSSTTLAPATTAPVNIPPSIVVVLPPQTPVVTQVPADRASERQTTVPQVVVTLAPTIPAAATTSQVPPSAPTAPTPSVAPPTVTTIASPPPPAPALTPPSTTHQP